MKSAMTGSSLNVVFGDALESLSDRLFQQLNASRRRRTQMLLHVADAAISIGITPSAVMSS